MCIAVPASQLAAPAEHGTLVVRHGGVYTGSYRSENSAVPCIRIDTTEPVTLQGCQLEGAGTLIEATNGGAQLIIRDCTGVGLLPSVDNKPHGRFLEVNSARSVRIENNEFSHTSGILIYLWGGDGSAQQTLTVLRNVVRNADGRFRNGGGTFATFIGLNGVRGLVNAEIAWNQVINEPNNSRVEDNINFYNSSGTAYSPLRVHDNYIYGAFPYPATDASYTGSGVTTDGDGDSALTTTAYIEAYHNQLVATCAAMNIAAGHDNSFHDNRIVSSGLLPDGTRLKTGYAAIAIWNAYEKPKEVFHSNRFDHNTIAFYKEGMQHPFANRHDVNVEACTPCTNTEHLPNPITLQTEQHEWDLWQHKLQAQRASIGPRVALAPKPAPQKL
ncbi:hypothetical protein F0P96_01110 [Hymenobacter busanensis]|uniref:Uncharacterized protein n=1 Tax=Hymenobacter busanensis TaxID=2607656 RepID=A0A7L4ZVI8_9BACT|nr:hypothetical protein [Hymenobacter busanensis]KAA9339255.1 hypothetical protein F0P96_01110 [Hymenobacter busanensis]QHJ06983.1 hypothetical protein GUY19_06640 [Hymenobacter busanensis]